MRPIDNDKPEHVFSASKHALVLQDFLENESWKDTICVVHVLDIQPKVLIFSSLKCTSTDASLHLHVGLVAMQGCSNHERSTVGNSN